MSRAPLPNPLTAGRRLALLALGWALLYGCGPGILTPDGLGLAVVAPCALWAAAASRPGPRAVALEALTAGLAWAGITSWAAHVLPATLIWLGAGYALYFAAAGGLLRRLARAFPLALAAPAAWVGIETLCAVVPPPFGQSWMRLGTHVAHLPWIAGGVAVFGLPGLSWALAALGGLAADLAARRAAPAGARRGLAPACAAGLLPAVLCVGAHLASPPPETTDALRVLLVQPNVPQERKMEAADPVALFDEAVLLTEAGLREAAAGGRELDLVCWGETMLSLPVLEAGLPEAIEGGARSDPWALHPIDAALARDLAKWEAYLILPRIFGGGVHAGVLPEGTAFVAGVELFVARDGRVRRRNAVQVWEADGARGEHASKRVLVPGSETLQGLERFELVRESMLALANYVPDFLAEEGTGLVSFADRRGRRWSFGVAVCYDNAFDAPFLAPLAASRGDDGGFDLAFHLVASNEAWFHGSQEFDQMVAFSRLAARMTGRSVVRATNSGVSCVIGPDGRVVARLTRGGRDRQVRGTLESAVPIPAALARGEPAGTTPWARWGRLGTAAALLVPALLLGLARRAGYRPEPGG